MANAADGRPFAGTAGQRRAVPLRRLLRRSDFVAAKRGDRAHQAPFVLQCRRRDDREPARIGITVTRKTGGAVVRNRIKRRLKSAIAGEQGLGFRPGYDYVLIARPLAASAPFGELVRALKRGLETVHTRPYRTAKTARKAAKMATDKTTTDTRPTAG